MHVHIIIYTALAALLLPGCSTIFSSNVQEIRISTNCKKKIFSNYCTATNDEGKISFMTPNSVKVKKSYSNLNIYCEGTSIGESSNDISSGPGLSLAGNIIAGGIIGAIFDLQNSYTYEYPYSINIEPSICKYIQ